MREQGRGRACECSREFRSMEGASTEEKGTVNCHVRFACSCPVQTVEHHLGGHCQTDLIHVKTRNDIRPYGE